MKFFVRYLAAQSGYGTNKTRLGKDSVGDFDCCCLTLQPCANPVITYVLYIPYSQRTPPVRHFECQKRAEKDGVCEQCASTISAFLGIPSFVHF